MRSYHHMENASDVPHEGREDAIYKSKRLKLLQAMENTCTTPHLGGLRDRMRGALPTRVALPHQTGGIAEEVVDAFQLVRSVFPIGRILNRFGFVPVPNRVRRSIARRYT